MAAQKGSDLLIKIGDGASPEVFTTVAGLRTKTLKFNAETVDVTNSDSLNKWRELLAGAGVKMFSASGSGLFKDKASSESLRAEFFAQSFKNYQVVIPGFGTIECLMQLTDMQMGGDHNKELTQELTLESAAEPAWTPAA